MKGWKTWVAAFIIGASAAAEALGYGQYSDALMAAGAAMGLVGLGHKLDRR